MSDYRFEAIFSDDAANLLRGYQGDKPPFDYLERLRDMMGGDFLTHRLVAAAKEVQPIDLSNPDPTMHAGMTFIRGGLPAIQAANMFLTEEQRTRMYNHDLGIATSPGVHSPLFLEVHETARDQHLDRSERGWDMVEEPIRGLFDEWAATVAPEIEFRPYFQNGFGFMVYLAAEADKAAEQQAFAREIDVADGTDWDEGLRLLTPELDALDDTSPDD